VEHTTLLKTIKKLIVLGKFSSEKFFIVRLFDENLYIETFLIENYFPKSSIWNILAEILHRKIEPAGNSY
jgi:hypothetical protein